MLEGWTPFELDRQQAALAGYTTVANLHKGVDDALVAWAQATGRYVYIGEWQRQGRLVVHKRSPWFNPYGRAYGDNATRVALYAGYLDGHPAPSPRLPKLPGPELLQRLPEIEGMVLCCWCAPEPCHGDELLRRLGGEHWARDRAAREAHGTSPPAAPALPPRSHLLASGRARRRAGGVKNGQPAQNCRGAGRDADDRLA